MPRPHDHVDFDAGFVKSAQDARMIGPVGAGSTQHQRRASFGGIVVCHYSS